MINGESDDRMAGPAPPGHYANYFKVGHNALEFLVDFGEQYEGETARVHTRIVTSPFYARALLGLLQQAFAVHEAELREDPEG